MIASQWKIEMYGLINLDSGFKVYTITFFLLLWNSENPEQFRFDSKRFIVCWSNHNKVNDTKENLKTTTSYCLCLRLSFLTLKWLFWYSRFSESVFPFTKKFRKLHFALFWVLKFCFLFRDFLFIAEKECVNASSQVSWSWVRLLLLIKRCTSLLKRHSQALGPR